ncbi:HAD family hydrolase [Curtobacterium ammoniigenes]|uniref:HAD family hydrolase n=1 Tax=Curtobacterium ammoniigenes TaxID=395387 RepID=UPI0009FA457F|nr:HAD family hydrolase [Curtobacterium ammoniigenes]
MNELDARAGRDISDAAVARAENALRGDSAAPPSHGAVGSEHASTRTKRWLVALDIDGTVMREDGTITEAVVAAVNRVATAGHEVMLATGRSAASTLPVAERLGIRPRFLVCANGAITLERDDTEPTGYRRAHVETFDPTDVLQTVHGALDGAAFGVEDETGKYRIAGPFPDGAISAPAERVSFEDLLGSVACRVVVISPGHDLDDFLSVVDRMGLHKVSYTVGWTAWLDIAPDGVTKATAMERVREHLDIPRSRVFVAGDGRNDIGMLQWASTSGRGMVMGQAPEDVVEAGNERTATVDDDGLVAALHTLPQ